MSRVVGLVAIPPFGLVLVSGGDMAPYIDGGGCLTSGAHPAFEILIVDDSGTGGSLCIVETSNGQNVSCNCDSPVDCSPNAITGFASDGTNPCVSGFCQMPRISVEAQSWGRTKTKYRQ